MTTEFSAEKLECLKNIANHEGLKSVIIEVRSGSMKGDGYMGVIDTVIMKENNSHQQLNLIVKTALSNENLRKETPIRKAYEREIFLYENVFPRICEHFNQIPKYYGGSLSDGNEFLVLENLKEQGFCMWNRLQPMNYDHIEIVFRTYAKFHASSIILKKMEPGTFENIRQNLGSIFQNNYEDEERTRKSFALVFENGFKSVKGYVRETAALKRFMEEFENFFKSEIRKIDKSTCILHSDCWCNNIMFKYEATILNDEKDQAKPIQVRLLDWQTSKVGSPVLDLSYFFYSSGSNETFKRLSMFLKVYYEEFSQTLEEGGINAKELLTFEEFRDEWRKFSKFGLFKTMFIMKLLVSDPKQTSDLEQLSASGYNIYESISSAENNNLQLCYSRISDVIRFMTENEFI